jgi:hypothetical protein
MGSVLSVARRFFAHLFRHSPFVTFVVKELHSGIMHGKLVLSKVEVSPSGGSHGI